MNNTNENLQAAGASLNNLGFKITAVDFDGTLCESNWPDIGEPNLKLINYVKEKKNQGEKIILWTCRVDDKLRNAVDWCRSHGLEFDAINDNIQEVKDLFTVCGRKIYYDELIDDKNSNLFDLPFYAGSKWNMRTWAQREVDIACKFERDNDDGDGLGPDYGCSCYESALRAFESLCKDGHSGFSIGLTKEILNLLIDSKSLTPIYDIPEVWDNERVDRDDEQKNTSYQCLRMSSLFKYVYDDGTIKYRDVNRYVCVDIHSKATYTTGLASRLIDELFPITMPYSASGKRYEVYCEDFLVDPKMGDYDTKALLYIIKPNGEKVKVNRFYKEVEDGWKQISRLEYIFRKAKKVK